MRTTPGTPGSAAHRRGSPVTLAAPAVAPWYERYRATIFWRPVYQRASLIAFSVASAPPLVKNDIVKSPGVISASNAASRARASSVIAGAVTHRRRAWLAIASVTRGCW